MRVVERKVCDPCQEGRRHWLKKKSRAAAPRAAAPAIRSADPREQVTNRFMRTTLGELAMPTQAAVAARLGLTEGMVRRLEAAGLAKLRNSPALKEAYGLFKEDGMPNLRELVGELLAPSGERLLDYQTELMAWWRVVDAAQRAGTPVDAGTLAALEKCRSLLAAEVRQF